MKKRLLIVLSVVVLVVMCSVIFAACVPSKPDKAAEKLKKADFDATVVDNSTLLKAEKAALEVALDCKFEGAITATVSSVKGKCEIVYFEKSSDAKKYADVAKKKMKDSEDKDSVVKRSGKAVYIGSKETYKKL